jgi:hypothetical protein
MIKFFQKLAVHMKKQIFLFFNVQGYTWRCKFFQRWR